MDEQLSDAEYELLSEALDDGFPDMLGRRNPNNRQNLGQAFSTNPLGQETTFFMPYEGAPATLIPSIQQDILDSVGGVFAEVNFQRDYLALNPFGFNLPKLKTYFCSKVTEQRPRLVERFNDYLATAEPYPLEFLMGEPGFPDVFDGVFTFNQWLENVLVPYSKIWFEHQISGLIDEAYRQEVAPCDGAPRDSVSLATYRLEKRFTAYFLLGRTVEHYRWKFKHERLIVQRKTQLELAGSGGGKSSSSKRIIKLKAFMEQIEALSGLVDLVTEDRIFAQAWDNAVATGVDMPKTPKVRFDYEVQIRSIEPFKGRYQAIFKKSA